MVSDYNMSNYIQDLTKQLQGKDVKEFTKHIQADQNISKILNTDKEKLRQKNVKEDIQRLLARG